MFTGITLYDKHIFAMYGYVVNDLIFVDEFVNHH
jgi:hypothetical protein